MQDNPIQDSFILVICRLTTTRWSISRNCLSNYEI